MGLYDRDYYRDDEPGRQGGHSGVFWLILINAFVYLVDVFGYDGRLSTGPWLPLSQDFFQHPWEVWRLVTYGFLHDHNKIAHIVFNMFGLWMFGTDVEAIYGRRLFLRMYLSLTIMSGLCWVLVENVIAKGQGHYAIGASGAISGIIIIYVMHFPHRIFLVMGVIPTPAWVFGGLFILMDLFNLLNVGPAAKEHVAFAAHLGGALFGYVFYRTHWQLFWLLPDELSWRGVKRKFRRSPKLRIRDEQSSDESSTEHLQAEVDRILEKISRTGEASLTAEERRTLEEASQRYKQKRR